MDEDKQREIASKGGRAATQKGANFAGDRERASAAGKKGAAEQPREAKAEGGRNSHRGDRA